MTSGRKTVQIFLIFIGIILILMTYFFYPKLNEKIAKKHTTQDKQIEMDTSKTEERNSFENVEYRGLYNFDSTFSVKSEKAQILDEDPDLVYMDKMKVTIHMNDGRVIVITSEKGNYHKITNDCIFFNNVKVTDGETVIFSENLDLLASEDFASIYNDVFITNDKGSLAADKIDYNFETKFYKVSMYDNKKVKMKIIR
tara:strand:+ start:10 stop:603 length:594 start_codon:yes stop_codon:yes gene_type:complete